MSFHLSNLNFIVFKKEILFLFNPKNKIKGFNTNSVYFLHLAEPNGAIVMKLPFRIISFEDADNVILNLFVTISCYLDHYIGNSILFSIHYHSIYTVYIAESA
jgi:hypothetical protein